MHAAQTRRPGRFRLLGVIAAVAIAISGLTVGSAAVEPPTEPQPYAVSYSNFESSQPDVPWTPRGEGVTVTATDEA